MLFDTHAHYYSEAFDPDRDEVLSALPAAGVGLVQDTDDLLAAVLLEHRRQLGAVQGGKHTNLLSKQGVSDRVTRSQDRGRPPAASGRR